jgi:hypothetical protein
MISDDQIQEAFDYLNDNATDAAQARANRLYLEDYTRVLKARLMGQSNEKHNNAQERYAYASPEYAVHLEALKTAIEKDETHRWKLKAMEVRIDAWRTEQSNYRAMGKIG